jgi:ABC-type maltose transport system permease subunit
MIESADTSIPAMVVFLVAQRRPVEGLTFGAVKG